MCTFQQSVEYLQSEAYKQYERNEADKKAADALSISVEEYRIARAIAYFKEHGLPLGMKEAPRRTNKHQWKYEYA